VASFKDKHKFEITCSKSKKQYALKVLENDDAETWVRKINDVIRAHNK
jgi:hypothetical protein